MLARIDRRSLIWLLLAATLAMRVLVPQGYMPVASAGFFSVAPCPTAGAWPLVAQGHHDSHDGHEPHGQHDAHGHDAQEHGHSAQPCAFAGLAGPAAPPPDLPALPLPLSLALVVETRSDAAPPVRAERRIPPARAPPLLV